MNQMTAKPMYSLTASNFDEAMKIAQMIVKSSFCPSSFKGNASDVLIAVQMGSEIGLQPIQAIQNISVINGRPCIWGDAMLALVQAHPAYESMSEKIENDIAYCTIKRKGEEPHTSTFSVEDAKKAGLLGKQGPWTQYPKRMLQMRARGFALRDKFSDALKGLIVKEEAQDYVLKDVVQAKADDEALTFPGVSESVNVRNELVEACLNELSECESLDELNVWTEKMKSLSLLPKEKTSLIEVYKKTKHYLETLIEAAEIEEQQQ